ncbi:MAG TPA: polysaccharide deacetylase family protein [Gaiellaceae bacterium]|nr:polysaccharide deacetylase family protein [Gaiellaceae bacterium]
MRLDWFVPAPAAHVPRLAERLGIERTVAHRAVALTFDDGPHPEATPSVLELLARNGASATFFLVGEQVSRRPALARAIHEAGHEIAVHGYRHQLLLGRTSAALADDLARAVAVIADATGCEPTVYRPPYGVFSAGGLDVVRALGWRSVLWSVWGRDWERRATGVSVARRVTRRLSVGDVVLLHDSDAYGAPESWRATVSALPSVLSAIAALGVPPSAVTQST